MHPKNDKWGSQKAFFPDTHHVELIILYYKLSHQDELTLKLKCIQKANPKPTFSLAISSCNILARG